MQAPVKLSKPVKMPLFFKELVGYQFSFCRIQFIHAWWVQKDKTAGLENV
jgi:hypothetical protein